MQQPTLLQSWLKNSKDYEAEGRKLAIYLGPGGNAGAIGGGITTALYETNSILPNAHYIGSSVGAYSWMYTLMTADHRAPTLFGTSFSTRDYFNPFRLLGKKPSLNLDYVVHQVLEHHVPMNYNAAQTSSLKLYALTTTSAGELDLRPLYGIDKPTAQQTLKATAAMPLIGRTTNLTELSGWDGWLTEPHLLAHLQTLGITDVVWILNRPLVETSSLPTRLLWQRIVRKLQRANPALATLVTNRLNVGDFLATPPQGLNLEVIHPHINLPGHTRNSAQLFHALGTAYRHMATYLGHPNLPYPTEWAPYNHHMPQ